MARYLEIYDNTKTYFSPIGEVFTPEYVMAHYGLVNAGVCVIETNKDHKVFGGISLMSDARDRFGIDDSLSDEEALTKMIEKANAPQPAPELTAEDRIAAALEYQNLVSM